MSDIDLAVPTVPLRFDAIGDLIQSLKGKCLLYDDRSFLEIESELSSICDGILKVLDSQLIGSASGGDSKIEWELSSIFDGILKVLDSKLIGSASGGDSKVFYLKMKGDYYRYLAELKTGDERKLDSLAQAVADEMQKVYMKELRPTPVPLTVEGGVIDEEDVGITLNCLRELMQNRILLFFISYLVCVI
ncbi:putative 14-3-3 protein [Helianthus debilis subsp. tardiflorus]